MLKLIAGLATVVALAGCTTYEDIKARTPRAELVKGAFFERDKKWQYIDETGTTRELDVWCGNFWGSCFTTPDGDIELRYNLRKSSYSNEHFVINGEKIKIDCLTASVFSNSYVCG